MKFRVFCTTDNKWEYVESLTPPTTCPTNASHTLAADSLCIDRETTEKDYIKLQSELAVYVATKGFNNLTQREKEDAADNFVISPEERLTVRTIEEQKEAWKKVVDNTVAARNKRWDAASMYISFYISGADRIDLADSTDIDSRKWVKYKNANLLNWIQGLGIYTTTGFPSKSYWTQGHQDKLIDILVNGNY